IGPCGGARSNYQDFGAPRLRSGQPRQFSLYYETLSMSRRRDRDFAGDNLREMESPDWASLSDEQLLERRISSLGLTLEGTPLQGLIQQLYNELSAQGRAFLPPTPIVDEWFV